MRTILFVLVGTAVLASLPAQAAEDCTDRLAGLWGAEVSFGPEVRGDLTIYRRGASWNASITGITIPIQADGRHLHFRLPGDRGEFRGQLLDHESRVQGHWIQPILPHVWGQSYATPVELTRNGVDIWRGNVVPLDDAESIFLKIGPNSSRVPSTFVRSPERNLGQYLGPLRAECDGDRAEFIRSQKDAPLRATYDHEQGILSLYLPTESATFDLTRRGRNAATGFYPRIPEEHKYSYQQPVSRNDGWETASLADVGIDPKPIVDLVQSLIDTPISDVAAPYPQAFLLARHGKLVLEEYFFGFHSDHVHDVRSAGKTLTTTLIGIEMQRGAPFRLDTKATTLFPQYDHLEHDTPSKHAITIEHLLTMTSGLDADDDNAASPGTEDRLTSQKEWYKFTLDLPMAHAPGEKAVYSAAGINLLGGVIQQTTGSWLPDFIYEHFARPLNIRHYHLPLGASGDAYMAGGILMCPRDFMKLGQLFLSNGRWRGLQIVSQQWALDATRAHASINAAGDYGYGWWIRDVKVGERTYHTYRAAGNGGQMVIVIPDLDLVAVFMGGNYNQGPVWWRWNDEFVPKILIPAAVSRR